MDRRLLEYLLETPDSSTDESLEIDSLPEWSSSSDTEVSDGNDDENALLFPLFQLLVHGRERLRIINYLETVRGYDDDQFKSHFRLPRRTVNELIGQFHASEYNPLHRDGREKISSEVSILISLWYMGNSEPLRTLSDRFNISESSVFRVIRRVLSWMESVIGTWINWPQRGEIRGVTIGFQEKRGINGCIGSIDGTHITIKQPTTNYGDYYNRKKYFSVILQGVVDHSMKFTDICCGVPGSVNDARVLRRSMLYREAERDPEIFLPGNTFLLGDSAYPSLPWLVTPFRDNGALTAQQAEFNFLHSSTRMAVEKAFGLLKGRFRRLKFLDLSDMVFVSKVIVCGCMLHNICIDEGDEIQVENDVDNGVMDDEHYNGNPVGQDRRMALFNDMFG